MKAIFSRNGIPAKIGSDNGSQYMSRRFKSFKEDWGISHTTSSPEYPQDNGLAKKMAQIAKNLLTRCKIANSDPFIAILEWRNTPVDGYKSPNELLKGRSCRSIIPLEKSKYQIKEYNQEEFMKHRKYKQEKAKIVL